MRTPLLSLLAAMTLLAPGPAALAQIEQRCVLLIDRFEDLTGRPVVQVIYDQVIRIEQSLEFDIDTATPSDQSGLTFRLSSAPAGMTINPSTGQVLWDPSPLQVGVFSATVLVEDSQGLRSRDTFCVEVVDDAAAPLITPIGDSALTVGQTLQLQVEATDPNPDDTVSFSLDEAPAGMTINAQSGLIEWIASLDDLGPNDVVVRASDDRGQFDLEAFALNVVETNAPPVIEPIPDRGAQPGIDVAIQVTASDPDDNNLAFRLLDRPAGMQINTETGLISWVPVTQQLGAHPVTVEVNDPAGFIDQTSFQIVVDFNRPPVAIDDGGYRVERGDTLSVPAPGILGNDEDPNNDPLTAQLVSGPTRGSVTLNPDGSFDYTPDNPAGQIGFVPALEFLIPGRGPIAPPLIADVNDDGRTDVVSQISNGVAGQNVFIISSPDTGELIATSPPLDRGVINGSGKALADIDLDGYVEIISIGGENSLLVPSMTKVFAFEHDG
ncbi:MAG: putative Ig domain-containing protein, partial [Wenzhouxiangella sp.]|nr:putative Ig domain-containing protein [Wenzhouxiangella sp.]